MNFVDLLNDDRPHVFDGAMGTMLYQNGVFINRCYDEINLKQPELVTRIHEQYVAAGAELVETNTYGANPVKLAEYGLEDQTHEINAVAARIAREAVRGRALVGGAIGPLGIRIEPYGPTSLEEARAYFRAQVDGLADGGVDFIILETFADPSEIREALLAVRDACDLPVVAQMTINEQGTTVYGTNAQLCAQRLDEWGADVVGLNCSVGPHAMLTAVEAMVGATSKKISAQPNAGLPREIHGRKMYMASPEYMAKYAQRMIRAGARFVGGCCGTTPAHIRQIADAVHALSPRRASVHVPASGSSIPPGGVDSVPLAQRSRLGAKLVAGELITTVEIVPPKGVDPEKMLVGVKQLRDAGVDAINVPDGPRAQMRMGALATSVLIQQQVGIESVLHYSCRDRNLLGMLSDLIGAQALGLRNLLLITGDPPKMGPYPEATAVFDIDAIGLTNLVNHLNKGLDPGGNAIGAPTEFTIGVGLNHASMQPDEELKRFYWKVDAGAEYAITQPIFDAERLLAFVAELDKRGLHIPIVAGIWPLVSLRNAEFLANEVPGVVIPDRILERMRRASEKGGEHALAEGIAIAKETFDEVRSVVRGVQVSAPFGRVELALDVIDHARSGASSAPGAPGASSAATVSAASAIAS